MPRQHRKLCLVLDVLSKSCKEDSQAYGQSSQPGSQQGGVEQQIKTSKWSGFVVACLLGFCSDLFFVLRDRASLCSPGYPEARSVDH